MKRKSLVLLAIIVSISSAAVNSFADVRLKTRTVAGKYVSEKVTYLKGRRQREETKGLNLAGKPFDFALIRQCNLRKAVGIDNLKKAISSATATASNPSLSLLVRHGSRIALTSHCSRANPS